MSEEALALLRSIDASLKQLLNQRRVAQPKAIASDRDLDSKWGDPQLMFMPRDWTGASFKGRRFSECPAALLDLVAEAFEYFATKAEAKNERTNKGKPVADYKRADAARARGWAKRIRDGRHMNGAEAATGTNGHGSPAGWSETGDGVDDWSESGEDDGF